jgi:mono/diheme cytochrome c family protein
LYRVHCARCHGITGNGRGETAALVEPYPRDYRPGIFKFKSTDRGSKPLKEDLARVIKHGIAGSSMVAEYQLPDGTVGPLPDDQIAKLVDYVIYLSIRGEVERAMLDEAAMELDLEAGDRLVDPTLKTSDVEAFEEQWSLVTDVVEEVAGSWLDAEDAVVEVEVPDDLPVPASYEELNEMLAGDQAEALKQSIDRGRELFVGTVASCSKCHGVSGRGDGQEADYDDWTKDWTVRAGLKPDDEKSLTPLIARGALPPKTIKPRNFEEGVFRGGSEPEDLYRRLIQGIAGTPMPAVTLVEGQLEERDVWHLINFVRSLKKVDETQSPETPAAEPAPGVAMLHR